MLSDLVHENGFPILLALVLTIAVVVLVKNWPRQCPHCLARIRREAKVCRYCTRDVPPV
jgi:hypothetical protein